MMTKTLKEEIKKELQIADVNISAKGLADRIGIDATSEKLIEIQDACLEMPGVKCVDLRHTIGGALFFYWEG